MRRSVLVVLAVMLALLLSSCGHGDDAPTVSKKHPFVGEEFTLSGTVDTDGARPVTLESFDEQWDEVADAKTSSDGSYRFTTSQKERSTRYRVVAPRSGKLDKLVTAPVKVTTVEDAVTLSVVRAGRSGTALGESKFRKPGRTFKLQRLDGTTWKTIGDDHEDQHGRTKIAFEAKGSHFYRLVGDVIGGTQGATSPAEKFARGPKKLGPNVIYITVEGGKNPIVKGADYKANAVLVTDGEPSKPLRVDEFEVRGNSSADKVKHPYKMKFKKSRRPFNLPEDKTWILLANYGDRSFVRTALGYDLGAGLNGLNWTPRSAFTELYVNGEYVGSYQISESVKIDKNRINIDKEKGIVVEVDKHFKEDHVPGFYGDHKIPYAFKDPDERKKGKDAEEGITDAKVTGIKSRILDFEQVLYGSDFKDPENGWTKYLDLDSAVDYYLVKEFTKENDGDFYRSNFFYTDDYTSPDSPFFMGPVWDFDRSAGSKPDQSESGTTIASPTGWWLRGHGSPNHSTDKTHWYVQITKDPVFLDALKKRWAEKRGFFKDIADHGVEREAAKVGVAADNDRIRYGPDSPQRLPARATTYKGEIAYLKDWYQQRFAWMDNQLR
jgi:hypothetical protein